MSENPDRPMPRFRVIAIVKGEIFEEIVEAPSSADAGLVLGNRLRAERGVQTLGMTDLHVSRLSDE